MRQNIAFWNILLKDMRNYYLKPPNISWGIIFPFAWMLMMFVKTKAAFNIEEVFSGIVAMSIVLDLALLLFFCLFLFYSSIFNIKRKWIT